MHYRRTLNNTKYNKSLLNNCNSSYKTRKHFNEYHIVGNNLGCELDDVSHFKQDHVSTVDFSKMIQREPYKDLDSPSHFYKTTYNSKHTPGCFLGKLSSRKEIFPFIEVPDNSGNPSKEVVLSKRSYSICAYF